MLKDVLPDTIYSAISKVGLADISDIRIRVGSPITIYSYKNRFFLFPGGVCAKLNDSVIYATHFDIKYILSKISNNALYSINDDLVTGFVTLDNGVRVGVTGEIVSVLGVNKTIKNITSICIRIPHFIKNCSLDIFKYIVSNNQIKSTLIFSGPGMGKTTMLKDIIYQLDHRVPNVNIAVVDSRKELVTLDNGLKNVDVCRSADVSFAIESLVRSMCPSVIILDEISISNIEAIDYALTMGVSIIASMHARNIDDVKRKLAITNTNMLFDRFVCLDSDGDKFCKVSSIYNKDFSLVYYE